MSSSPWAYPGAARASCWACRWKEPLGHMNGEMTYLPGWDHLLDSVTWISLGHRAQIRAHPRGQGQLE